MVRVGADGGSFKTKAEASARKGWIAGELAALRVPDVRALVVERVKSPTVAEAAEKWRAGRVDVAEGTRVVHRVALARCLPLLGTKPVDELTVEDVNALVASLSKADKKRERKRSRSR
ncbi:MAG TPA: hypothetical protein VF895_02455 [Gaiellaceae bacterium]